MSIIINRIYEEFTNGDGFMLMMFAILLGLSVIILISRKIGRLKKLENRNELLLLIDINFVKNKYINLI